MKYLSTLILFAAITSGCGEAPEYHPHKAQDDFVLRARVEYVVTTNPDGSLALASNSQPVTVVVSPNVTFSMSATGFVVPTVVGDTLSFGDLTFPSIRDNNIKVCGTNGTTRCNKALLRMYTVGTPGPGFWNSVDAYGVPAIATGTGSFTLGLNLASAQTIQSFTIPLHKNVVRQTDFPSSGAISVAGDFSNAGSGTYTTTLVVEYGLSL